jgi:hypothetical protein
VDVVSLFSNMARRFRTPPDIVIDGKEFPYKYSGCVVGRACHLRRSFLGNSRVSSKNDPQRLEEAEVEVEYRLLQYPTMSQNVRGWLR